MDCFWTGAKRTIAAKCCGEVAGLLKTGESARAGAEERHSQVPTGSLRPFSLENTSDSCARRANAMGSRESSHYSKACRWKLSPGRCRSWRQWARWW